MKMTTQEYINKTRQYLDYVEEHINNVRLAFNDVCSACRDMYWVRDTAVLNRIKTDVQNHDISKLGSEELAQYRDYFYPIGDDRHDDQFEKAWANHLVKNKHHWQSIENTPYMIGTPEYQSTVEQNIVHMVIDWTAMSYKFGGTAQSYYEENKKSIKLNFKWVPFLYQVFSRIEKHGKKTK